MHSETGEYIDLIDNKTFSTEFSHTRFLVPSLMNYKGWALFMDCDMLALCDLKKIFAFCEDRFAAMCVKHQYQQRADTTKMDGRAQRVYYRKNWSSFMLWNCSHPANRQLTPAEVTFRTGQELHGMFWLEDEQIGMLPYSYNYISGISPKLPPERGNRPDVVHYSDGGPWFENCKEVPYADWWIEEHDDWQRNAPGDKFTDVQMRGER